MSHVMRRRILLATDGSADSALAARRAVEIARASGAELHLVHVVPVTDPLYLRGEGVEGPSLYEEDVQQARGLLEEEARRVSKEGGEVWEVHLKTGEPDAEIVALGEELGADMIVVGSRGSSPLRRPIGSVSSSVAAHAHCPVLVVRGE